MEIKAGYQPVKTIKKIAEGAVIGTIDLFAEMTDVRNDTNNILDNIKEIELQIKKIKAKLNEITVVINNG